MATDTKPIVQPARYGGYVATFAWNGARHRVFFDNAYALAGELAGERVDDQTIEAVVDAFERLEWQSPYPLFEPPDCAPCRSFPAPEVDPPPTLAEYVRGVLWMGLVAAPWVGLVGLVRWKWGV